MKNSKNRKFEKSKNNFILALAMTILASASWATTYYASPDGASDATCLSASTAGSVDCAVALATESGDIIQLAAGTYNRTSPITLQREGLVFRGASEDAGATVIKGPGSGTSFTAFVVTKKTTIENVTITGFYATSGGSVVSAKNVTDSAASDLTAINCVVTENNSPVPAVIGGVWSNCVFSCNTNTTTGGKGGAAKGGTFRNCRFDYNRAGYGGAAYTGVFHDCAFYGNAATSGSSVYVDGSRHAGLYGCAFTNNASSNASSCGGTVAGTSVGVLVVSNCVFSGNSSQYHGGAGGPGTYYDCFFTNNTAKAHGAALYKAIGHGCRFVGNRTNGSGGAVSGGTWYDCVFVTNRAVQGGAASVDGQRGVFYNCAFSNNVATTTSGYGGTLWGNSNYRVFASNCVFSANYSRYHGGGGGYCDFYDCFFTNNVAKGGYGGAVYRCNTYRCRFIGNKSSSMGGAMAAGNTYDSLFVGNSGTAGGAISSSDGDTYVYNCVFSNNVCGSSASGGAVYKGTKVLFVSNCYFVANTSGNDGGAGSGGSYYDCVFKNNSSKSTKQGGALYYGTAVRCVFDGNSSCWGAGTFNVTAVDCIYTNNVAVSSIGAVAAFYKGSAKNCLITGNRAPYKECMIIREANCINCTIAGNETVNYYIKYKGVDKNCIINDNVGIDIYGGTHSNVLYNTSAGSPALVDCINRSDAKFNAGRDPSLPYYYLRQGSPARNAGIDVGWTAESLDLRGKKRLVGAVDLGCYEYQPVGFSFIVR